MAATIKARWIYEQAHQQLREELGLDDELKSHIAIAHQHLPSYASREGGIAASPRLAILVLQKRAKKLTPKRRGRPATGRDPVSAIRLPVELTAAIDKWAARNDEASRSDAIRRLVELGLTGSQPMSQRSAKAASKASEMAGQQIDKLVDPSATAEERQQRKRRLLKGPGEFRDLRADLPKKKA